MFLPLKKCWLGCVLSGKSSWRISSVLSTLWRQLEAQSGKGQRDGLLDVRHSGQRLQPPSPLLHNENRGKCHCTNDGSEQVIGILQFINKLLFLNENKSWYSEIYNVWFCFKGWKAQLMLLTKCKRECIYSGPLDKSFVLQLSLSRWRMLFIWKKVCS